MAIISKAFRDFNLKFSSNPFTGDIQILKDVDAIKNSIINLLKTNLGERPFQPNLGSRLYSYLFEIMDYGTIASIEEDLRITILNYEPRVILNSVYVNPDYDTNAISIDLNYTIVGIPLQPQSLNILIERA